MNILSALAVGIVFGCGVQLMVGRDAIKLAAGTLLISNAAVLLLVSAGFDAHEAPILPIADLEDTADPLVQALALTALVIGFGTTVLLLRVALAVERTHDSIEMEDLMEAEIADVSADAARGEA